jgi:hypothetical protein
MQYEFPLVIGGYRYNLLKRCLHEVGIEPLGCGDVAGKTVLNFARNLTALEQEKLCNLMDNRPTYPPVSETVFKILDIGEFLDYFVQVCGIKFTLYCSGEERTNYLELHCNRQLNDEEINKVKATYASLIQ